MRTSATHYYTGQCSTAKASPHTHTQHHTEEESRLQANERQPYLAAKTGMWESRTRFLIGRDAVDLARKKIEALTADFKACEKIAVSADYDGHSAPGCSFVIGL